MSTDNPGCGEGEHQRDQLSFRNRERQLYLEHRIGVRLIELELAQSAVRCLAYDKTLSRTKNDRGNSAAAGCRRRVPRRLLLEQSEGKIGRAILTIALVAATARLVLVRSSAA
jgi:hypothetical protein